MGTTNNPNILFMLSGLPGGLPLYVFEQNPETMEIVPPMQGYSILRTIEGNDVYQKQSVDNETRTMSWSRATRSHYANLKLFSTRDSDGNIPICYFWDGTLKEMQGAAIKVIDVYADPMPSNYNNEEWKIKFTFRLNSRLDKMYKLIPSLDIYNG